MKKRTPVLELTADQAKEMLGVTTREGVVWMCNHGKFPGARKLDPTKTRSAWLIPVADIEAYLAEKAETKKKRAQAVMA